MLYGTDYEKVPGGDKAQATWEITRSSQEERDTLRKRLNHSTALDFEMVDILTWNVTLDADWSDTVTDWARDYDLEVRLI